MSDGAAGQLEHLDEVTRALEELAGTVGDTDDFGVLLRVVCEQVVRVVPGADMASITVLDDTGARTAAATDERAAKIDGVQYDEDDGPCLRAARTGDVVRVEIGTAQRLWPRFTRIAEHYGVASYLASPLQVRDGAAGAINLFGFGEHAFRDVDQKYLELYATVADTVLHLSRRALRTQEQVRQLRTAMRTRGVIEQAKGILMAARRITADEAFQLLVGQSQRENTKLHTVSARFVAEHSGHEVVLDGNPAD
ncbi:GAF and ANTAR domain-containing protein [Amycolatopsis thermophila]|uniref:GAF domain-containing protein n=1 Tax=Amycolatopsis thermophila TaxID=206084 RepID=A0ABU0F6V1_9PSEU|nr:GAF and ANTAR domain-containing protein [Amycolatopsis thermophila]MDQ0383138.1 GAF domain-containing protein [Amycolatopsis thermophila]